jgi:signal transduction histidine kinase
MPLTGDASDRSGLLRAAPLLTAVRQLAARDVYGLVWIGADLVVESTYGPLVGFVAIGEPVTASIYALTGMDEAISSLREGHDEALELPDVTLVMPTGRRPRATLSISWSADDNAYVLLVARTETRSELEGELTAQMRARMMAEAELAAKTREVERINRDLERANADLESYAAIISHDLQSPMRVLRYTLDDLECALSDGGGSAYRPAIAKLRDLSRRMTGMLSGLLDYASVIRKREITETIDTAALVRAIVASIDRPQQIEISIEGDWPVVETAAAPLDLVVRNLIDNAVKHHDREIGRVTVTVARAEGALFVTVTDDGPGIAAEHHDVAFLPFTKLQPDRSAPILRPTGEGMGLALVRRTVESVGGSIALTSPLAAGRGSSFNLRWPTR